MTGSDPADLVDPAGLRGDDVDNLDRRPGGSWRPQPVSGGFANEVKARAQSSAEGLRVMRLEEERKAADYAALQPTAAELQALAMAKDHNMNCMQFACQGSKLGNGPTVNPALVAGRITAAQAAGFSKNSQALYTPENKEVFLTVLDAQIASIGGRGIKFPDEDAPPGMHEICVFIYQNPLLIAEGAGYDFHVIVKCSDGEWVSKHGLLPCVSRTSINDQVHGIHPPTSGVLNSAKQIIGAWFVPGPPPIDPVGVAIKLRQQQLVLANEPTDISASDTDIAP